MQHAISGPLRGTALTVLPLEHSSREDWRRRHPDTLLLSFHTGHRRDYGKSPYSGYGNSRELYFPIHYSDKRYHPKEVVLGLSIDDVHRAYSLIELSKRHKPLRQRIGKRTVTIELYCDYHSARVLDSAEIYCPRSPHSGLPGLLFIPIPRFIERRSIAMDFDLHYI